MDQTQDSRARLTDQKRRIKSKTIDAGLPLDLMQSQLDTNFKGIFQNKGFQDLSDEEYHKLPKLFQDNQRYL